MRYFRNPESGDVYGYDEADEAQAALMQEQAVDAAWVEVTGVWPPVPDPVPSVADFLTAIKVAMGGIVALNGLMTAYPLLTDSLGSGAWADAATLLADAKATGKVTADQAAAINAAAVAAHVPVAIA